MLKFTKCFNSEFDNDNNQGPSVTVVQYEENKTLLGRISSSKAVNGQDPCMCMKINIYECVFVCARVHTRACEAGERERNNSELRKYGK